MKTLLAALLLVLATAFVPLATAQPRAPEKPAAKLSERAIALDNNKAFDANATEAEQFLRCFSFKVPQGSKSLNIVTANATGDIDLLICFNKQPKTLDELEEQCAHNSSSARFNEVFTIDASSEPPLRAGTYYIYAGSLQAEVEGEVSFTIVAALDIKPQVKVAEPRPFALTKPEALQRAMDSSVRLDSEFSTGSGTLVSPKGLILTCHHVIEDDTGAPLAKGIYVSITRDPRRDPVQCWMAETVFAEKSLDLALLRIVADLDGKAIEKPGFPFSPLGDDTRLMLGEDINCLGYPGIGGSRSIYGITLTRGIVAGFIERKGGVQWIKTDALISSGNSGGGAFNARYELVGVPSEAMHAEDTFESLGYLRPVGALPEKWRRLIVEEYPK